MSKAKKQVETETPQASVTVDDLAKTLSVAATPEMLEENPDLKDAGVNVGDEVDFSATELDPHAEVRHDLFRAKILDVKENGQHELEIAYLIKTGILMTPDFALECNRGFSKPPVGYETNLYVAQADSAKVGDKFII